MTTDSHSDDTGDSAVPESALWTEISDDVERLFGSNVDITVKEYDNHLDVRIVPNGAVDEIEAEHEDLKVVPYQACQMTIRTDD